MVTSRSTGKDSDAMRKTFSDYLKDYGTTVTLTKRTETLDGMGRVTAVTESTSTISVDIQWVTKEDLRHLNIGDVQVGDGMLFAKYDADIDLEDEITHNSIVWRISNKIEGELIQGDEVYQGFIIKKNA